MTQVYPPHSGPPLNFMCEWLGVNDSDSFLIVSDFSSLWQFFFLTSWRFDSGFWTVVMQTAICVVTAAGPGCLSHDSVPCNCKKRLFNVFFFKGLDLSNRALHWLTFKLQWWNIYAPEQLIMRAQFSARVSVTGKIIWIGLFIILLIYKVHIFWSVPFCTNLRGAHNRRGEPWVTAV